ncbi:hypothetical protein SCP_1000910 [Sparassis crispa]|uniref:DNA polymerase lambda n=1 Tax=Sparassis crispa TaxID=139825 RepID=A0A401GXG0_9APHY|nr:hypothetical protein SCP_1000910 [Sparassis crispa]GBE86849.1 hypothetical protein SCP_1000910 [Sparassis crispa]
MSDVETFLRELDERMNYPDEDIDEYLWRHRNQSQIGISSSGERSLSVAIAAANPLASSNELHEEMVQGPSNSVKRKSPDSNGISTSPPRKRQRTDNTHENKILDHNPPSDRVDAARTAYSQHISSPQRPHETADHTEDVDILSNQKDVVVLNATGSRPRVSNTHGVHSMADHHDPELPLHQLSIPIQEDRPTEAVHGPTNKDTPHPSSPARDVKSATEASAGSSRDAPKASSCASTVKSNRRDKVLKIPKEDPRQARITNNSTITTLPSSAVSLSAVSPSSINNARVNSVKNQKQQTTAKNQKSKKTKVLTTPAEYARRLQAEYKPKRSVKPQYLKGKKILYVGDDMLYASAETKGKMNIIKKHGGTLVATYDPDEVTHIVTDISKEILLKALGLRSLDQIPSHIHTVKWRWIISGPISSRSGRAGQPKGKGKAVDVGGDQAEDDKGAQQEEEVPAWMPYEFEYAAFDERIDADPFWQRNMAHKRGRGTGDGCDRGSSSGRRSLDRDQESGEVGSISEFTQDKIVPQVSAIVEHEEAPPSPSRPTTGCDGRARPSTKRTTSTTVKGRSAFRRDSQATIAGSSACDPLATFYEVARAERDELLRCQETDTDTDTGDESDRDRQHSVHNAYREPAKKRGFLCDNKDPPLPGECPNQDVIDKLQELRELHKAKPSAEDRWRVFSYDKAIRSLKDYPTRIKSCKEARAIRSIGEKTAQKIMEIIQTGNLRRIKYERTEDVGVINLLQGIYGVGRNTAFQWYAAGCRTLEDVKARKGGIKLSASQEIGLKFYADINTRMPRSEAAAIFEIIKPIARSIDPNLVIEIMGSFRRGKADCGDIDILITRPTADGGNHRGVLKHLLRELHRRGIITENLAMPEDFDDLELIYRGLCRRDPHSMRRRIDFLTVPYESRGAALLYYTGDDIFNRSMRLKANKMGYSLNQKGLFAGVVRNPRDRRQKTNQGNIIASETEREIFDILGVPWQEPHERVRNF